MEFRIYMYIKPFSYEHLIYRTFDSAERACRIGGEIQEWTASEHINRLTCTNIWVRDITGILLSHEQVRDGVIS